MSNRIATSSTRINIGLDPGFGALKAACVGQEGALVATVPSVVGVGDSDLGLLSVGNIGVRKRTRQPDRVSFDAGGVRTYLVGENVARCARPVERMDFLRLSDGPELRALFYDVIFRLLGGEKRRIDSSTLLPMKLMVGLPVEVMARREQALSTLRSLREWMVGEHQFTVDGSEVKLDIKSVHVMAQPAGSFFAWGLNDEGQWIRSKGDLEAPVAICDIGFNTLDLVAFAGGEVIGRFTAGDTVGIRRAAEMVIHAVRSDYGVSLSLHGADALLRDKQPRLYTAQGEKDLRAPVRQALDTAAAAVLTFVERQWGGGQQFAHLLFTGGGAEALRDDLLRHYPQGVVLPDPVMANALGLARYAVRVFEGRKDADR